MIFFFLIVFLVTFSNPEYCPVHLAFVLLLRKWVPLFIKLFAKLWGQSKAMFIVLEQNSIYIKKIKDFCT